MTSEQGIAIEEVYAAIPADAGGTPQPDPHLRRSQTHTHSGSGCGDRASGARGGGGGRSVRPLLLRRTV
jgi:hypothetical protein